MRKLTNRTKILLSIAGLVVVVVVAGLVLLGPGETGLFGASTLVISPSNYRLASTNVTHVFSVNSIFGCDWYTSNDSVIHVLNPTQETKAVQVITGGAVGTATLSAHCGVFRSNHVSTTVTTYNPYAQ